MRVNLAGHSEQYFVCGREGTLPPCARILDFSAASCVMEMGMK